MELRKLRTEDYPVVDNCMQQLHNLHVQGRPDLFVPVAHPYSEEVYGNILTDGCHITVAAVDGEELAGFCIATIRSNMVEGEPVAYIDDMFVRESFRQQGIAARLFAELERRARKQGIVRIDLMVWEFNGAALAFYESLGMTAQRYVLEKKL